MSQRPELDPPGPLARVLDDPRVAVAERDPRDVVPEVGLYPEEVAAIKQAVLSRRQQFTAGRQLARRAWQALGRDPAPLLNDARRVPIWPSGLIGTITHTHSWCGAAVALASQVGGLGADVEASTPLDLPLWERVCRPEEQTFLNARPEPLRGLLAKGIFSAKESIYKALYPSVRVFLDFQGMSIALTEEGDATAERHAGPVGPTSPPITSRPAPPLGTQWAWHATLQVPWGPHAPGQRFGPGKLRIEPDLIVSGVVL
jgi:4'-phosphopantetheinyl transferase EntD